MYPKSRLMTRVGRESAIGMIAFSQILAEVMCTFLVLNILEMSEDCNRQTVTWQLAFDR